jgi:lipid A 3-O-deacylase
VFERANSLVGILSGDASSLFGQGGGVSTETGNCKLGNTNSAQEINSSVAAGASWRLAQRKPTYESPRHDGSGSLACGATAGRRSRSAALLRTSGLLGAGVALAVLTASVELRADELTPDHAAIYTLQDENASISSSIPTDRYYVNGLRGSYTTGEGDLPMFVQQIGHSLWGDGSQRMSFEIGQLIFTPNHTEVPHPVGDEPYAGALLAGFSLLQDHNDTRSIIELQAGLVGPDALGKQVQNGFHAIIGMGANPWCCNQIQNEPVGELTGERIWRVRLSNFSGLETDVLPNITVGVGNLRDYALSGAVFRIGQGLESDYGVSRVRPGMTGGDAYTPVKPLDWYLFGGFDGQVVAHDITLDGNTFGNGPPSVPRNWLVGDLELGGAVMFNNWRLSYTQVFETHTFRGEQGGLHQFGSLALSARF